MTIVVCDVCETTIDDLNAYGCVTTADDKDVDLCSTCARQAARLTTTDTLKQLKNKV